MRRVSTAIVHAGILAIGLVGLAGCSTASTGSEHTTQTQQAVTASDSWVVVPAYYWSGPGDDANWNQLLDANWAARAIVIVTGPASGPPTASTDIAALGAHIDALHQRGAQVLSYVNFTQGRSYQQLYTDVMNWKYAYPNLEGIFYDVAARPDTSDIGKAKTLWQLADANFNYASQYQPATVIFNWGETNSVLQPYIDCVTQAAGSGRFDVGWTNVRFVSWEGFDDHVPPPNPYVYYRYTDDSDPAWSSDNSWVYSYRPDMFIHLVHDFTGAYGTVADEWALARSRNASAFFVTDQLWAQNGYTDQAYGAPPSTDVLNAEFSSLQGSYVNYPGSWNNPPPNGCIAPDSCACPDYTPSW